MVELIGRLTLLSVLILPVGAELPADERKPIGWDQVYGTDRLNLSGGGPFRVTWINETEWVERSGTAWNIVDAVSGSQREWFNKEQLIAGLTTDGLLSREDAQKLVDGDWKFTSHKKSLVVFEHQSNWIRIQLDGSQKAIVKELPDQRELEQFSPMGNAVAFVRNFDLWIADFDTGVCRQLTFGGNERLRNGKADWVYFEEVYNRRWDAFRWSPDGNHILFQQFDDAKVPVFNVNDDSAVQQKVEIENFPKAGETNPVVRLGVVSAAGGDPVWMDSGSWPADDLIISGFQWTPDSQGVIWFAQNRIQTYLDVVRSNVVDGSTKSLLRDKTEAWVDNPGDVEFLSDGSFLMFSERTGWKHLYRVSADGSSIQPLTSGEWEVRALTAISADESSAVVTGTKDSLIAENLYRVSLNPVVPEAVLLTPGGGNHTVTASPQGSLLVDSHSSLTQPASIDLRGADGRVLRELRPAAKVPTDRYRFGDVRLEDVPMADGSTTRAIFVRPPDFDPNQKYPVWLMTYGGPHAPGVKDTWSPRLLEHMLANLGIVVIRFDPRSASGYGARSAWVAYRKLGVEETRDLVSVCNWLEQQSWVDGRRIGMNGHSYGGYFTAYAMTHCDKLCAGIAGAPVTDWANYDTIYTERFMSTPQENPDGYRLSSVTNSARDLKGRLLILHGLKDDNVHPANTFQLVHQLQRANKDFELMVYPTARHGIFGSHYERTIYNFIVESMGKPEARR